MSRIIYFIILIIMLVPTLSFGADKFTRFTHNDQSAIIVGRIVQQHDIKYKIEVSEVIYSNKDMNGMEKSISPNKILKQVELTINSSHPYKVGDYIVASVDKMSNNEYKIAWGIYKATTDNAEDLKIMPFEDEKYNYSDLKAIEIFINSRGKLSEFEFEKNRVFVVTEDKKRYCISPEYEEFDIPKTQLIKPNEADRNVKRVIGITLCLGWVTLAITNTTLTQSSITLKSKWFLLSLLIGPIATFSLLLLKYKKNT